MIHPCKIANADRLRLYWKHARNAGVDVVVPVPMPPWFVLAVVSFASGFLGALAWGRYLDAHGAR